MSLAGFSGCIGGEKAATTSDYKFTDGAVELESPCMIFVPAPKTEKDALYIALVSQLTEKNGTYNPLFIVGEAGLDSRQKFTIDSMSINGCPKYAFGFDEVAGMTITEKFPMDLGIFENFKGYSGEINVSSYREALWFSGLAATKNMRLVYGNATAKTMDEAWGICAENGMNASYVVMTNSFDWSENCVIENVSKWHIASLSAVAAELAHYHKAMVLTTDTVKPATNDEWPFAYGEGDMNNERATGNLMELREFSAKYGKIDYMCIVGSGAAVPQFRATQSDVEDKGHVAGDVFYGFTENDETLTTAVGRIIGLDVATASNMVSRILGYNYLIETNVNAWTGNTLAENGYEVADARGQTTPGLFFTLESQDEGYNPIYTSSVEAGTGVDAGNAEPTAYDLQALLEKSNLIAYRGHGSSTGTFYSWSHFLDDGTEGIEDWNLAPSTVLIAACLTGKIYGYDSDGSSLKLSEMICMKFLKGGIVSYVSPTEVSYSEIGQDATYYIPETAGFGGGWGVNNYIYCNYWNNIMNYEMSTGGAFRETLNGYMADKGVNPFTANCGDADGKTITMYCLYGDPMFKPWQNSANAGAGNMNLFENGITGVLG
jgi:hypothetical protein